MDVKDGVNMDYEKEMKKIQKENKKYLDKFWDWLKDKGLKEKTIRSHVSNADLYINDYLNYYELTKMEEGYSMISNFLGDWFIRKCMWSIAYSVKTTAASIKKFYNCMMELGYVSKENYDMLCFIIKDEVEEWIEEVNRYNSFDDFDDFMF